VATFGAGPVILAVDHPHYAGRVELNADTVAELLSDLQSA
jgi:hypothetical protein